MNTVLLILLSVTVVAVVGLWLVRQGQKLLRWVRRWLTPGLIFSLSAIPLSDTDKYRFAALAVVRNCTQNALLAECIKCYLQEKGK
jgi:hypothetical protein